MKSKRVAIALIRNDRDEILMGLRNDNSKFTNPGGHLEGDEDPYMGCVRELKEETGLDAKELKLAKVAWNAKKKILIYVFDVTVDSSQEINPDNDPDKECDFWAYLDPNDVREQLHVPVQDNVALKYWIES